MPAAAASADVAAPALKSGLDLTGFDRNVRPQDDLYRFAVGAWLAKTEIPADRSNYGSFSILDDQSKEEIRSLVVATAQQTGRAPGSDAQKVGDYYNTFMDTTRIESLGIERRGGPRGRLGPRAPPPGGGREIGSAPLRGGAPPRITTPKHVNVGALAAL